MCSCACLINFGHPAAHAPQLTVDKKHEKAQGQVTGLRISTIQMYKTSAGIHSVRISHWINTQLVVFYI